MCHHYRGVRTPPEHLANEFSARTNLRQLLLPDASYYPLKPVPVIRLDANGDRELVEMEWRLLPLWWKPSAKQASGWRRSGEILKRLQVPQNVR
jgi:putative SOS response-associated peptidase YedK